MRKLLITSAALTLPPVLALKLRIFLDKVRRLNLIQSTITEETFQTLLVSRALEKLGYQVSAPEEVDYNVGYTSIAKGDATFMAVNWQPLQENMFDAAGGNSAFYREGHYVTGAAQGYLIDKKTAGAISHHEYRQLKDPQTRKTF